MIWLILFLALLSGCGQGGEGKVVLRISAWGGAGDDDEGARIEKEVLAEFERRHPGVEIQMENTPGSQDYVRKLLLSFIAHSEPDVIRLDASSQAVFINNGVLMDLTPIIKEDKEFSLDDYYPNVLNIARKGDSLYAIPVDYTPLVVYYNKTLFDKAGVPYPEPGWTWDDFLQKAKKLTEKDEHGFTFTNWMPGWLPWIWCNGGDVLDDKGKATPVATSKETEETIAFFRDMVNVHKVAPSFSQMAAQGVAPFLNGDAAMETSGHWYLSSIAAAPGVKPSEVGVAPLPVSHKGGKPVTVIYESGWAIGRNCRKTELAWEFIKYFTSEEVQRKYQTTGIGVCARKDIAEERAVDARERFFLDITPTGRRPWGASIEGYDFVETAGQNMMDSVFKAGKSPKEALAKFAADVDRQMEKQ